MRGNGCRIMVLTINDKEMRVTAWWMLSVGRQRGGKTLWNGWDLFKEVEARVGYFCVMAYEKEER